MSDKVNPNKELIILAAKAMGYDRVGGWDDKYNIFWDREGFSYDPTVSYEDAFNTAMMLGMTIYFGTYNVSVEWNNKLFEENRVGTSIDTAAMLAITKCAAYIGSLK